jgi:hypothetical protein
VVLVNSSGFTGTVSRSVFKAVFLVCADCTQKSWLDLGIRPSRKMEEV